MKKSYKVRIREVLDPRHKGDTASAIYDYSLLILIFLNVISVILESVDSIKAIWVNYFEAFEFFSVIMFSIDYLARLAVCTLNPTFSGRFKERLRHLVRPMALIDLVSILPFFLPFLGLDLRFMRVIRLFRVIRIAHTSKYNKVFQVVIRVFRNAKEELIIASIIMGVVLVISSSIIYICEQEAQPDQFSSIPASMWWSIETLTTVGYGDLIPVTPIGRFFASIIAVLGVCLFALPIGIIGAGFVREAKNQKDDFSCCPHCGKSPHEEEEDLVMVKSRIPEETHH